MESLSGVVEKKPVTKEPQPKSVTITYTFADDKKE
jgi:hypothetical protein